MTTDLENPYARVGVPGGRTGTEAWEQGRVAERELILAKLQEAYAWKWHDERDEAVRILIEELGGQA